MKTLKLGAVLAMTLAMIARPAFTQDAPAAKAEARPAWPAEPRWQGSGPMPRHYLVSMWGLPQAYAGLSNPLPIKQKTLDRGERVYTQHCASCHGAQGVGDGVDGRALTPPPGNLVWLSDIPDKQWDGFMYWSITEGGVPLGTAMPAFRGKLSADEVWAVTAYVQANLPFESHWRSGF